MRGLIALAKNHRLPIRRLLCVLCRHTFALVPDFVFKFHRYAKEVIRSTISWLKSHTYEAVVEILSQAWREPEERNIAVLTLYFWRRKFAR